MYFKNSRLAKNRKMQDTHFDAEEERLTRSRHFCRFLQKHQTPRDTRQP
jgi:hypothetical protein